MTYHSSILYQLQPYLNHYSVRRTIGLLNPISHQFGGILVIDILNNKLYEQIKGKLWL